MKVIPMTHLLSEAISLVPSLLYHMLYQLDRYFFIFKKERLAREPTKILNGLELIKERIGKRDLSQTDFTIVQALVHQPSPNTSLKDGKGRMTLKPH